jgi:hypothetical protein
MTSTLKTPKKASEIGGLFYKARINIDRLLLLNLLRFDVLENSFDKGFTTFTCEG